VFRRVMLAGWLVLVGPAVGLGCPTDAVAQSAPARIEVKLVKASRGEKYLDARLRDIANDLRSLPYDRFDELGAGFGDGGVVASLPNGVKTSVTVRGESASHIELAVVVERDGRVLTTTTISRPRGSAGVLSIGRDGESAWVVTVRALAQ
jgi:hypothetical protein